jgi:hypothetical protein
LWKSTAPEECEVEEVEWRGPGERERDVKVEWKTVVGILSQEVEERNVRSFAAVGILGRDG